MSNKITLLPEYISLVQQPAVDFYSQTSPLLDYWEKYLGELETFIEFEKTKSSDNIKEDLTDLFKKLNNENFTVNFENTDYTFDDIFKLFVVEKFNALSESMKKYIRESIGDDNIYFVNYSDDIGDLVDDISILDSGTNPYYDIYSDDFNYSSNLPTSLNYKVSANEKAISQNLTLFNDTIMKTSLNGILSDEITEITENTAKTSHGSNLITDVLHIKRVRKYKEQIKAKIKAILSNMADLVNFVKQVNYKDKDETRNALPIGYLTKIENIEYRIDLLKERV